MKKKKPDNPQKSQILLYQTEDGQTRLEVQLQKDTVWLSLNQMAELFQRDKSVISKHIKNIFEEGEISLDSTVANFATVQSEGDRQVARNIECYNLDVIKTEGTPETKEKMTWQYPGTLLGLDIVHELL